MPKSLSILSLALSLASPLAAVAQPLAGAPQVYDTPPGYDDAPGYAAPDRASARHGRHHHWRDARVEEAEAHPKACYARVHVPASYGPPPTGPEYVWRQAPAPPGAPGPVWCLTVQPLPQQPVMIAPERMGWIRVLCADQVTPDRVALMQRRLSEQGLYRGGFDGRYDVATAQAVGRFQQERGIDHGGYLSYQTWGAIAALPPPAPPPAAYWRRPTTFDTGVLSWSGKVGG
jgi:hypothetical protein